MFLNCSTCFGRHIAHHQELKNCNCSLWFYIHFWLPVAAMAEPRASMWVITLHYLLCNWTRPLPHHSPSCWLRLFSSQTFPCKDTPTILKFSHSTPTCLWRWNRQSVPKWRHIKFRRRGITQKKTYNIQNTAKVWNQEWLPHFYSMTVTYCWQFHK